MLLATDIRQTDRACQCLKLPPHYVICEVAAL